MHAWPDECNPRPLVAIMVGPLARSRPTPRPAAPAPPSPRTPWVAVLTLVALGAGAYANALGGPLLLDLPTGAGGAAVLQGSSPTATVRGDRLTVTGPFAAGVTSVQVGFQLRQDSSDFTLQQTWPVPLEQLSVGVQKIGALSVSSPQFSTVGEVNAESGTPFFLANGPAMAAGSTLTVQLSNLPAHNATPRMVALSLAAGMIALGVWWAIGAPPAVREPRPRLIERRDTLLAELAPLEKQQRTGGPLPPAVEMRRQRLIAELEEVYGELDAVRVRPRGGDGDVAA